MFPDDDALAAVHVVESERIAGEEAERELELCACIVVAHGGEVALPLEDAVVVSLVFHDPDRGVSLALEAPPDGDGVVREEAQGVAVPAPCEVPLAAGSASVAPFDEADVLDAAPLDDDHLAPVGMELRLAAVDPLVGERVVREEVESAAETPDGQNEAARVESGLSLVHAVPERGLALVVDVEGALRLVEAAAGASIPDADGQREAEVGGRLLEVAAIEGGEAGRHGLRVLRNGGGRDDGRADGGDDEAAEAEGHADLAEGVREDLALDDAAGGREGAESPGEIRRPGEAGGELGGGEAAFRRGAREVEGPFVFEGEHDAGLEPARRNGRRREGGQEASPVALDEGRHLGLRAVERAHGFHLGGGECGVLLHGRADLVAGSLEAAAVARDAREAHLDGGASAGRIGGEGRRRAIDAHAGAVREGIGQ